MVFNFVYLGILAGLIVGIGSGVAAGSFLLGVLAYVLTGGLFVCLGAAAAMLFERAPRAEQQILTPVYAIAAE